MTTIKSSAPAVAPVTGAAAAPKLASSTAAEQQDRFMKLLVAQMKNQDPLNPMDNAQMTSQIAQINTVSGLEKLNRTVESLLGAFGMLQAQSAGQLPGRAVLVEGNALPLKDGIAVGGVELASAADSVTIEVLDAAGMPVSTLSLGKSDAGVRSFAWDGSRADGSAAPEGNYRMRVTASSGGKPVQAGTLAAAQVQAVSNNADGVRIDLGAAGTRPYSAIRSFL